MLLRSLYGATAVMAVSRRCCGGTAAVDLTRFNKIAIQGTPQMAVDKEALICLSRVYSYYFKCNFSLILYNEKGKDGIYTDQESPHW